MARTTSFSDQVRQLRPWRGSISVCFRAQAIQVRVAAGKKYVLRSIDLEHFTFSCDDAILRVVVAATAELLGNLRGATRCERCGGLGSVSADNEYGGAARIPCSECQR